jgi:serralysin
MSNEVTTVVYSGNPNFDGLLSGTQWASTDLTFSFPTSSADYNFGYIAGAGAPSDDFAPLNATEQQAVLAVLNDYAAVSNLQFTQITESTTQHANLREAQSAAAGAAMTFGPTSLFNEYPLSADS